VAITPRLGIRVSLLWRSPPRSASGKVPAPGLLLLCPRCLHPRRYLLAQRQRLDHLACRLCWGLTAALLADLVPPIATDESTEQIREGFPATG